jgi:hypothetical protein
MDYQSALPHPLPFSRGEKGVKSLSLRERGWGEGNPTLLGGVGVGFAKSRISLPLARVRYRF